MTSLCRDFCRSFGGARPAAFALVAVVGAAATAATGLPGSAGASAPASAPAPPDVVSTLVGALTPDKSAPAAPEPAPRVTQETPGPLPLGRPGLRETRHTKRVAPGVTLTTIKRGTGKAAKKRIPSTRNGPWVVHELTIDPAVADGRLTTTFGRNLAGTEPVTTLTREVKALAGVNGSFFSLRSNRKYPGLPVGLTISDGRVLSKPTGTSQEVTLALDSDDNSLRIGRYNWSGRVKSLATGESMALNRVNDPPVVPKGCALAKAASKPRCDGKGQLALFTPEFDGRTPAGPGVEVVLDSAGCPSHVVPFRGVRLRGAQTSLQGTGEVAVRLRQFATEGCLQTVQSVLGGDGEALALRDGVSAVTGRFRLVRHGKIVLADRGVSIFGRNPRTIAGVDGAGRLKLVTIDGRQARSVGATLWEAARVARALGMRDAVNLDGGGSTTMAVRGRVVNRPVGSERSVSDALVWLATKD